jgi:hypothetical protein
MPLNQIRSQGLRAIKTALRIARASMLSANSSIHDARVLRDNAKHAENTIRTGRDGTGKALHDSVVDEIAAAWAADYPETETERNA